MPLSELPQFQSKLQLPGPKKERRVTFLLFVVILSFLSGLLGGTLVYLILFPSSMSPMNIIRNVTGGQNISSSQPIIISQEEAVTKVAREASPAVVSIIISKDLPVFEQYYINPFGWPFGFEIPQYRQKGTEKQEIGGGTGFIVSEDGLVLTNKHVVQDEEADYTVLTNDGKKIPAKVLAKDPVQDIAILKIQTSEKFSVARLGDSDKLEIGQTVITIGNVLGEFRNSVSVGVISGLGRRISASDGGMVEVLEDVIQTDAAINQGNSGGPLLNLKGEVIGMNTAMAMGAENIGFAIPINKAKRDIEQVKTSGKISYPFLGIYYTLITPELKEKFNLSVDYGAWVGRDENGNKTQEVIFPGSPAEKAGLKQDDIILEFNGEKIRPDNPLAQIIMKYSPGDSISLKILRGTGEINLNVVLTERNE